MFDVMDRTFDLVIKSDVPALVDFWAPWCGPCVALGPTLERIENELDGAVTLFKVNVDENPSLSQEFGIRTIPTLLLFVGGNAVECLVGAQSYAKIMSTLRKYV